MSIKSVARYVFALLMTLVVFQGFISMRSESQLSILMRKMTDDIRKVRRKVETGKKIPEFYKSYTQLYSAEASTTSKKGDQFAGYAEAFLKQCSRLKESTADQRKSEYNELVTRCIRCHETYCPGPLTMLKKLKLP
jgi:argininosuccinate synthase